MRIFSWFDSAPSGNVCLEKVVNILVGRVLRELKGRDTWPHVSVFIQTDGSAQASPEATPRRASRPYLIFAARQSVLRSSTATEDE